jgi:serine/threonine protein kinase
MEYLEGGELFDKIKERGRLDENLARTWFREIVEAVKYIHDVSLLTMNKYICFNQLNTCFSIEWYCAQGFEAGKW